MTSRAERRVDAAMVQQLGRAVGVRLDEQRLDETAAALGAMLASIERCEALDLAAHEPLTTVRLSGGAVDAEL